MILFQRLHTADRCFIQLLLRDPKPPSSHLTTIAASACPRPSPLQRLRLKHSPSQPTLIPQMVVPSIRRAGLARRWMERASASDSTRVSVALGRHADMHTYAPSRTPKGTHAVAVTLLSATKVLPTDPCKVLTWHFRRTVHQLIRVWNLRFWGPREWLQMSFVHLRFRFVHLQRLWGPANLGIFWIFFQEPQCRSVRLADCFRSTFSNQWI